MGLFKNYVTCIMAFFTPFKHLSPFVNFTQTLPLWYSLNFTKKEWEKRIFFSHLAASAYHVISKEVRNHILRRNLIFRHICCINNPHWQSGRIIIFLYKYYIVISDTLVGFFSDVFFLLLALILSGLLEKPRRNKDWVTEKST